MYHGTLDPYRTAVPFWGQTTWSLSGLSPNGTAVLKGQVAHCWVCSSHSAVLSVCRHPAQPSCPCWLFQHMIYDTSSVVTISKTEMSQVHHAFDDQRCQETCQARQNMRCQGCRADCCTLKPSSLMSVKACQKAKLLSVKGRKCCLLTSLSTARVDARRKGWSILAMKNSSSGKGIRRACYFFVFCFLLIPFIIFAHLLLSLLPTRNSDPGSHSRLFSPLPATVYVTPDPSYDG